MGSSFAHATFFMKIGTNRPINKPDKKHDLLAKVKTETVGRKQEAVVSCVHVTLLAHPSTPDSGLELPHYK